LNLLISICTFACFPFLHDALILAGNNWSGRIPSELGNLVNLNRMYLCKYGHRVGLCLEEHGLNLLISISNFAFFPLLHDALNIANHKQLSGSIPSELGLWANLGAIWLGKYGHRVDLYWEEHGWNPSSTSKFAFFPLLHDELILGYNNLKGSVPSELGLWANVREVYLGKCGCRVDLCLEEHGWNSSSTFNFAFFPLLHDALILDGNKLSGSIPSELGSLTKVRWMRLSKYGRKVDLCLEEHGWNPFSTSNFCFLSSSS